MLKHLASLLAVTGLFVGVMALADTHATSNTTVQFVPYNGPYRIAPPPPRPLPEEIPVHSPAMRWMPGHWSWVGNGYRWVGGKLTHPAQQHLLRS